MRTDIATYLESQRATVNAQLPAPAPTVTDSRHTIIHGDCIRVLSQQEAASVDFVLTDPPYVVNFRDREGALLQMTTTPTGCARPSRKSTAS